MFSEEKYRFRTLNTKYQQVWVIWALWVMNFETDNDTASSRYDMGFSELQLCLKMFNPHPKDPADPKNPADPENPEYPEDPADPENPEDLEL